LVLALISAAVLARRSHPLFSLAILFYFTAQSMESSTIALELYFEHRNYLPSLLLFWPLAAWLCHAKPLTSTHRPVLLISMRSVEWQWIKPALALVLILGLGLMTHARASLWGNSQDQALLWAKLNADSPRAQANAAMAEIGAGHPERAITRLRPLLREDHAQVQLALNLLSATCATGHLDAQTLEDSAQALRLTRDTGTLLTSWFERAIGQAENPQCPELTTTALAKLLSAARTNPNFTRLPGRRQDLDYLEGKLALTEGKPDMALASFNRALDQQVRPGIALQQAALLGAAGYPSQALVHLDHYEAVKDREERPGFGMPRIHSWVLERQQYWPKELSRLRHTLRDDLKAQAKPSQ
jgi:tetratricopeptide (TPR) repeat protein